jgi:hypothetical protein
MHLAANLRKHWIAALAYGILLIGALYIIASFPLSSLWSEGEKNIAISLLTAASPELTFLIATLSLIALLIVCVAAFRRGIRRSLGFIIVTFLGAILLWVSTLLMTENTLMLREAQTFNHHLYYRAILQTHDSMYHIRSTLVLQCDSLGIFCQKIYVSKRYQGSYTDIDRVTANAVLYIDVNTNQLFLNIGNQQVFIA